MRFTENGKKIISVLSAAGYKAYFVGGCVRDFFMRRPFNDIDIASSSTPIETETALSAAGIRCIETGIKHGTVTAIINGESFEITTFRSDGEYKDNRHPENVSFVTDVKTDLARRDFTVNAMAYNENDGLVDVFGGIDDINNKIIRCVGNHDKRFNEDALRIIRALRFSSVLGFEIEENTQKSIFKNKDLLKNIAAERIFVELKKLLCGDNAESVLLKYKEVIAVVVPELAPCFDFAQNTKWHLYDVYTHIVKSVGFSPKTDYMRLTLLLHDVGKPYCLKVDDRGVDHFKGHQEKGAALAERALRRLKCDNATLKKVVTLISVHDEKIYLDSKSIKYWLRRLGDSATLDFLDVKIADMESHNLEFAGHEVEELERIKQKAIEIINSGDPYRISDLKIRGNDLISVGISGKSISDALNYLVEKVSDDKSLNDKNTLLKMAKEFDAQTH